MERHVNGDCCYLFPSPTTESLVQKYSIRIDTRTRAYSNTHTHTHTANNKENDKATLHGDIQLIDTQHTYRAKVRTVERVCPLCRVSYEIFVTSIIDPSLGGPMRVA